MKNIDKELLRTDLSNRLPYKTYCALCGCSPKEKEEGFIGKYLLVNITADDRYKDYEGFPCLCTFEGLSTPMDLCEVKPYLRRLDSITEEERQEVEMLLTAVPNPPKNEEINNKGFDKIFEAAIIGAGLVTDWLDLNHFDYRGLIDKDMAIEVNEKNNPYLNEQVD